VVRGIEQGWTIAAPPQRPESELTRSSTTESELWIGLEFDGLFPRITEDGLGAFLVDHGGRNRMRYVGLVARDMRGRQLRSSLRSGANGFGVSIDTTDPRPRTPSSPPAPPRAT
jgi:hypothetical protein